MNYTPVKIHGYAEVSGFVIPETSKYQSNFYPTITYQSFFSKYTTLTQYSTESYEVEPIPVDRYYINTSKTITPIVTSTLKLSGFTLTVNGEYLNEFSVGTDNLSATIAIALPKKYTNKVVPYTPKQQKIHIELGSQNDTSNLLVKFENEARYTKVNPSKYHLFSDSSTVSVQYNRSVTSIPVSQPVTVPTIGSISLVYDKVYDIEISCDVYNISDLQFEYHNISDNIDFDIHRDTVLFSPGSILGSNFSDSTTIVLSVSGFGDIEKLPTPNPKPDTQTDDPNGDYIEGWVGGISDMSKPNRYVDVIIGTVHAI